MEKLLAKYFSGEATGDEVVDIEKWRSESQENSRSFLEARIIWVSTQKTTSSPPPKQIPEGITGKPVDKEVPVVRVLKFDWLKYAVAAVVIFAAGFVLTIYFNGPAATAQQVHTLADGSVVSLDKGAILGKVNIDENIREVFISGRGFFDIQRDEARPFIVNTEDARIEVLGTSFLVDTRGERTEVRVESGLVALAKPSGNSSGDLVVKLKKGEYGTVSKKVKGIIKRANDNPNYLSWKTKVLVFDQSKLSEVKTSLEDVYSINIVLDNPSLHECQLTAKYNKKKAKDVIEIIARTFNLTYEFSGNTAILKGKGC